MCYQMSQAARWPRQNLGNTFVACISIHACLLWDWGRSIQAHMYGRFATQSLLRRRAAGLCQGMQCPQLVDVVMGMSAGDDEHRPLKFKIIDYGHSKISKQRTTQSLPKVPFVEHIYMRYALW